MKKHSDETAALRPEVAAKVAQHYAHAREKHSYFADCLFLHGSADGANGTGSILSGIRWCLDAEKDLHDVCAETALNCEIAEAAHALATGDEAAAVEECYDAIAVLLRIVDALEGRQPLGDPKRKRKGAAEMTRVVRTDGGRFAVEWRSYARPYGWIRVSDPAAPNVDFLTEAEAEAFDIATGMKTAEAKGGAE